ncbi:MAG: hypothetical protein ACPLRP_01485 [Candidatus Bipolaricaulaceae bacterium]
MAMAEPLSGQKCYLLLGEAPTEAAAEKIAEVFSGCPYVYFLSAFGRMVVGVFYLRDERAWWLQAVAESPEITLGLVRAAVYVTDRPAFPLRMEPRLSPAEGDRAPCGAYCPECPRYKKECKGCPASPFRLPE